MAGTDGNGERRINTWVSTGAHLAHVRFPRRHCVTKRELLERLITTKDDGVLAGINEGSQTGLLRNQARCYALTTPGPVRPS